MTLETIASGVWAYGSRSLLAGDHIAVPTNQSEALSKAIWSYATRTLTGGGVVSVTGVFTCNVSSLVPVALDYTVDIETLKSLLTSYDYNVSNEAELQGRTDSLSVESLIGIHADQSITLDSLTGLLSSHGYNINSYTPITNGVTLYIESMSQVADSNKLLNLETLKGLVTLYTIDLNSDASRVLSHIFNEESVRVVGISHTFDEETLNAVVRNMFQNTETLLGIRVLGVVPIETTSSYVVLNMGATTNIETIVGILRAANGHIESSYALRLSKDVDIELLKRIEKTQVKNITSLSEVSIGHSLNVECLGGYVIVNTTKLLDIETTKDMVRALSTNIETTLSIMKTTLAHVEGLGSLHKPVILNLESLRSLAKTQELDVEVTSSIAAISVSSTFNLDSIRKISSGTTFDVEGLAKRTVIGILPINVLKGVLYSANHNFEIEGIEPAPPTVAAAIVADALIKSQNNDTTVTFWGDGSVIIASTKSGLYIIPSESTIITSSER